MLFRGEEILIGREPTPFPDYSKIAPTEEPLYIGSRGNRRYFALLLEDDRESVTAEGKWVNRRSSFRELEGDSFWISARAYQLARWDRESRYCGKCGSRQRRSPSEIAKECPTCGHREYPRVAPAMIVAVVKEGRLLMAHAKKHREGLYSVLAGFVEPGESLERCVAREVLEESGVRLGEIRYFDSQSWPFPYSLMVAFTAEGLTEEITIDEEEIGDAAWFAPAELVDLPAIPPRMSVSRSLIDWFVENYADSAIQRLHGERP